MKKNILKINQKIKKLLENKKNKNKKNKNKNKNKNNKKKKKRKVNKYINN